MKLIQGDVDLFTEKSDWTGFTTNGVVTRAGKNPMGVGTAKQAAELHPILPEWVGGLLSKQLAPKILYLPTNGWVACKCDEGVHVRGLFTFPTKHDWRDPADIDLIEASVLSLALRANEFPDEIYTLPVPGVGHKSGMLRVDQVMPFLELHLPDNVRVIQPTRGKYV